MANTSSFHVQWQRETLRGFTDFSSVPVRRRSVLGEKLDLLGRSEPKEEVRERHDPDNDLRLGRDETRNRRDKDRKGRQRVEDDGLGLKDILGLHQIPVSVKT